MTWDRVERLIGAGNLERLARSRVGVIGLGSGGGYVALTLAMSGVGNFVLVDDDTLEANNIMRHVADRRYIGQPKAEAVADLIHQRNPKAKIELRIGRVEDHTDALEGLDILVPAVDGEGPKFVMNEAALAHNLTAVYAGVYERGEGGDAVIIQPYDGPCYACWAQRLREGLNMAALNPAEELDYGMIGASGTLEAEPGLWLHVTRVAGVQADLVLNELLQGTEAYQSVPGNTVILANRALEIIAGQVSPPYTAVWANIARDPGCLVCGRAAHLHATLDDAQAAENISLDELADSAGIAVEEDERQD